MSVTVASAERSFSKLKKHLAYQNEPGPSIVELARLSIETDIAKTVNFDSVIQSFAKKKARKAFCHGKKLKVVH